MPATQQNATDQPLATVAISSFSIIGLIAGAWARLTGGYVASAEFDNVYIPTGSYTLSNANIAPGTMIRMNNGSAANITVPQDSSFTFPIGHKIPIYRANAQFTVQAGSGATVNFGGSRDNANGSNAYTFLLKIAANEWLFSGDTATS